MKAEFTQEEQKQIIEMYQNNVCIEDIMEKFHSLERPIRLILKENKIDRGFKYNCYTPELYQRMIDLYIQGYTYKEIEETLVLTYDGIIRKTLRKNNIHIRTYSESNRRYYRDQHYFDEIDTPNKAYFLGLIYADGCNNRKHSSLTISLQEEDKDVLTALKNEIKYEGPLRLDALHEKNKNYKNQYVLCINDQYISQRLEELGVVNNKSLILKFPNFLQEELISHFIRGYFDGDGCIYNNDKLHRGEVHIVGTLEFCNGLSNYLKLLDCPHIINQPKQSKGKNTYIIRITGTPSCYKFLSWIYNNSEIKSYRKYQRYLYMCDNYNIGYKPQGY